MARLRAFISGTQDDMEPERRAVADAIATLGVDAVRAETHEAVPLTPRATVLEMVRESDIYIGVYGRRYGFVSQPEGISVTELEFREARRRSKPILVYVAADAPGAPREPSQVRFLEEVLAFDSGYFRRPEFTSSSELANWVRADVAELVARLVREHTLRAEVFVAPPDVPGFVDRESELEEIAAHLTRDLIPAPVHVSGLAGVGKTALAIRFAHRHRHAFPGGVVWLDGERSGLEGTYLRIATAFGEEMRFGAIRADPERLAFIQSLLMATRPLVIVDGGGADDLLGALLPLVSGCPLLITTRRRDLPSLIDAHEMRLRTLGDEDAVALIATAMGRDYLADEREAAEEICRLVGNLSLPLKVVGRRAGRSGLHLTEMVARIRAQRLSSLRYTDASVTSASDVSMSFMASYKSLSRTEAHVFTSLGVFDGVDFDADAAAAVACVSRTEADRCVETLIDVSLVETSRRSRWKLHPLVRDFARERSESEAAVRMVRHYDGLVQAAVEHLEGPTEAEWTKRLELDYENVIAALRSSIDSGSVSNACSIAGSMFWYWSRHGRLREGHDWLQRVVALPGAHDQTREAGRAQLAAGALAWGLGAIEEARGRLRRAVAVADAVADAPGLAYSLTFLSVVESSRGDTGAANEFGRRALDVWGTTDDPAGLTYSFSYLGWTAECVGDRATARPLFDEALLVANSIGQRRSAAWSLIGIGLDDLGRGVWETSARVFSDAERIACDVGDDWVRCWSLAGRGNVLLRVGQIEEGREVLEEALSICRMLGERWASGLALCGLGRCHAFAAAYRDAGHAFLDAVEDARSSGAVLLIIEGLVGLAGALEGLGKGALARRVLGVCRDVQVARGVSLTADLEDLERDLLPDTALTGSAGARAPADDLDTCLDDVRASLSVR